MNSLGYEFRWRSTHTGDSEVSKGERIMSKRLIIFLNFLTILIVLAGCASNPPISSLTSQERERVSNIVFIESGEIPSDSYKVLGSVRGLACKRNLYASGSPSVEEARQGVKIRAAQLGANAVLNVLCEENQKVDWVRNCWQSIVCVGDAIMVDDPTIIQRIRGQGRTKLPETVSAGIGSDAQSDKSDSISVKIIGYSSPVLDKDTRRDCQRAMVDAKQKAIERAGVTIEATTVVKDFKLFSDYIESKSKGILLPGYEFVEMGYDENGIYKVLLIGDIQPVN